MGLPDRSDIGTEWVIKAPENATASVPGSPFAPGGAIVPAGFREGIFNAYAKFGGSQDMEVTIYRFDSSEGANDFRLKTTAFLLERGGYEEITPVIKGAECYGVDGPRFLRIYCSVDNIFFNIITVRSQDTAVDFARIVAGKIG